MSGPSNPRGERTGTPGARWETVLMRTETLVDDPDDTSMPGMNEPSPPRSNRAGRRAAAREARRRKT